MTTWKMVTGEDGNQYLEFNGQVVSSSTWSNADGVVLTVQPTSAPYTIESIEAMRNGPWDTRWPQPYLPQMWPQPYLPQIPKVTVNRWLPGDSVPGSPEPERPAGRFQNLDWEEAS